MVHKHVAIATERARTLVTCARLEVAFCECGAFRLNGCNRWAMPLDPELTRIEAARYLNDLADDCNSPRSRASYNRLL
jgi:hypothetical protein